MFNSMLVKFRARLSKSDADRTGRTMLCLLLVFTLLASAATVPIVPADPNRYLADIKILSAPNMEGRGPGTKGLERASKYIEHRYNALGLQPAGSEGYLQPFTVTTGAKLKSDNDVTIENGATKQPLKINQDFEPISFSASGSFTGPTGVRGLRRIGR